MFQKKKLYKIVYEKTYGTYETIIAAKNEFKALNKFNKKIHSDLSTSIISINEYINNR